MNEIQRHDRTPPPTSARPAGKGRRAADTDRAAPGDAPAAGKSRAASHRPADRWRSQVDELRSFQERISGLQQELARLRANRGADTPPPEVEGTSPAPPAGPGSATPPAPPAGEARPPAETAPDPAPASRQEGITITGSVRRTQGASLEEQVAFDDSLVAAERGIVGVRIDGPGDGVTFRFRDLGNGLVEATRYDTRDGEPTVTGTQTLALPGAGDTRGRGAAPGILTFDRLGLQLELDDGYTPGDLHFVDIASGPASDDRVTAGQLGGMASDQAPSASAGNPSADGLSSRLSERERQLIAALQAEQGALLGMLEGLLGPAGSTSAPLGLLDGAGDRDALLHQLAESLRTADGLTSDRVLQLLG